jgi:hypothetical protein
LLKESDDESSGSEPHDTTNRAGLGPPARLTSALRRAGDETVDQQRRDVAHDQADHDTGQRRGDDETD